ncbi:MAG TPA: hypothetical protein VHP37_29125 [Burkholderiales bacterium]|nr:hypothetical protein [Burkholderiales bacterium]
MLSQEAHDLATLIATRHSLICRAAELDAQIELATTLYDAPSMHGGEDGLDDELETMISELLLLPSLVDDLDTRIEAAWDRVRASDPEELE